ncbi:MAG: helix-turn-helix domain-containing protein [Planctomycetota bacterium]
MNETIPQSTASHHWRLLREAGVTHQTKQGTQQLNRIRREELDARFPGLLDAVLEVTD